MYAFTNYLLLKRVPNPSRVLSRTAKQWWYPDTEYIKEFMGPMMYPNEMSSKWKNMPWNGIAPPREMSVKNMIINFGCAHPAAHGLLRLVLELDGEVSFYLKF